MGPNRPGLCRYGVIACPYRLPAQRPLPKDRLQVDRFTFRYGVRKQAQGPDARRNPASKTSGRDPARPQIEVVKIGRTEPAAPAVAHEFPSEADLVPLSKRRQRGWLVA